MYGGQGYRPAGGGGLGFGPPFTPPIVKQLLITLVAVFVVQALPGTSRVVNTLGAATPVAFWQHGYLWQPFTYMWLHGGLGHIVMNAFVLWMFGSQLAMAWGPKRFLRYYLVCGVGAGLIILTAPYLLYGLGIASPMELSIPTVGASGAIYGVILAFSLTWPERTIMLIFPPVAFKAIWLIPALFFMTIIMSPGGNISHVGHLGGVLAGWLYLRWQGDARASAISWGQIKLRWRRYRMRQKLRAVQYEDWERKRREQERRRLH